ncbi:ABC transporter substrate-binding protein [Bacteroidia bacterium]|nr:ABC transporter substrate-binding protein [Bacteroidia bacterium]
MCRFAILLLALLSGASAFSQGKIFAWHSHLSHNEGVQLLEVDGQLVYASTAGIVFPQSETELTKVAGLSDVGISALHYDAQKNVFLVGYNNGNIEIVPCSVVSTLSSSQNLFINDIKNDERLQYKKINRFVSDNTSGCFAATDFGIVEIDVEKGEIKNNFTIHPEGAMLAVQDLVRLGEWWVAATDRGIFYCVAHHPQWYYFGNWQQTQSDIGFSSLAVHNDTLFALRNNGELLKTVDLQVFTAVQNNVTMICKESGNLWMASDTHLYNVTTSQIFDLQEIVPQCVITSENTLFVADKQKGLQAYNSGVFAAQITGKLPSNEVLHLAENNGEIWAVGKGFIAQRQQTEWNFELDSVINDPVRLCFNPAAPAQIYVATSSQIIEFQSLIASSVVWKGSNISAMDFSAAGELLVGCSQSASPLHLRTIDGTWTQPAATALTMRNINAIKHSRNTFYGITDENPSQIFSFSSHSAQVTCNPVVLRNDYLVTPTTAYTLLADRSGEIWMGTNKGVAAYSASNIEQGRKVQVVSDMPEYAAYLLEYETVTTIAIDGGNRKWLGTAGAGVFLQSADGTESLQAFNESNSPLPSNYILSIAANSVTGEVLIATDKGVVGFTADATAGAESFSAVKIYPNPVRPQSQWVTMTGLVEDAAVKITDATGRLVYNGTASGGTLTWDLQHWRGGKVTTGVYFVFMLNADGSQQQVGKLLIVK